MNNTIIATQKEFDLLLNKALKKYSEDKKKIDINYCYVLKLKSDKMNYKFVEDVYIDSDFSSQIYNKMNTIQNLIIKNYTDCTEKEEVEYWLEQNKEVDEDEIKEALTEIINVV